MATARKKAADLTGQQIEAANKARDEEQALRAAELSMATAAKEKALTEDVVDLSDPANPISTPDPDAKPVVETAPADPIGAIFVDNPEAITSAVVAVQEVEVAEKFVTVRVNEDIDMTYAGVGYKLEVGPKYKLPKHIADHLEEKGIIWH